MAYEQYMTSTDAGIMALGMGILVGIFIFILIAYIIMALSLMKIAHRTKTENAWLAWIPIANIFLLANIAKEPWWWALIVLFAGIIPFIGSIISAGASVFLFWKVCERLNKPGALSLLMLIPIVNLGFMLYLAYSE